MIKNLKELCHYFLMKIKWRGICQLSNNVWVSHTSYFEGMNKIHYNSKFHGYLGYGSYIGWNCELNANIGRFSSIAPNVVVNCGTHPINEPFVTTCPSFFSLNQAKMQNGSTFATSQLFDEFKFYDSKNKIAVKIGSDCWIGDGAFIVGGIEIGDGAVVLAHAVVTQNVAPYSIVGGVPAKEIGRRFDDDTIAFLLKTKWWNNDVSWFEKNWGLFSDIKAFKKYYSKYQKDVEL